MTRRQSITLLLGAIATPWRKVFAKPGLKPINPPPKIEGVEWTELRDECGNLVGYYFVHDGPIRFIESDFGLELLESKSPNPKV